MHRATAQPLVAPHPSEHHPAAIARHAAVHRVRHGTVWVVGNVALTACLIEGSLGAQEARLAAACLKRQLRAHGIDEARLVAAHAGKHQRAGLCAGREQLPIAGELGGHQAHGRRVEPTAEIDSDRRLRTAAALDSIAQQEVEAAGVVARVGVMLATRRIETVHQPLAPTVGLHAQRPARLEPRDVAMEGAALAEYFTG
jgi:hypothetical protein